MKKYYEKVGRYRFCIEVLEKGESIITCYIPAYNLFFNAKDEDMIKNKARFMAISFFKCHDIKY